MGEKIGSEGRKMETGESLKSKVKARSFKRSEKGVGIKRL